MPKSKTKKIETWNLGLIGERLKNEIEIKDRKYRLKTYQNCFIGSAAVDWLVKNVDLSDPQFSSKREFAVQIGNKLIENHTIQHVAKKDQFADKNLFFQFVQEGTKIKHVVVIGGGFAGSEICRTLDSDPKFRVTLIDQKDYFEQTPAVLRTLVRPDWLYLIQARHSTYIKHGHFILGSVVEVTSESVFYVPVMSQDQKAAAQKEYDPFTQDQLEYEIEPEPIQLDFDYLVIASGTTYESGIKSAGITSDYRACALTSEMEALEKAKSVLIVGGGPVGIELAGEIIESFPDKKITLVHNKEHLMERSPKKAYEYAQNWLTERGVKLVFGDQVQNLDRGQPFITKKGVELPLVDKVFYCVGMTATSKFMQNNFQECLDNRGRIKVNNFFQVKGYSNIFAAGDICSLREERLAERAVKHAQLIISHIKKLSKDKKLKKSYDSPSKPAVMVVALGPNVSILVAGNRVPITGKKAALIKNGFIKLFVKQLGAQAEIDFNKVDQRVTRALALPDIENAEFSRSVIVVIFGALTKLGKDLVLQFIESSPKSILIKAIVDDINQGLEYFGKSQKVEIVEVDTFDHVALTALLGGCDIAFVTSDFGKSFSKEQKIIFKSIKASKVPVVLTSLQGWSSDEKAGYQLQRYNKDLQTLSKACGAKKVINITHSPFMHLLGDINYVSLRNYQTMVIPRGLQDVSVPWIHLQDVSYACFKCIINLSQDISLGTLDSTPLKNQYFLHGPQILDYQQILDIFTKFLDKELNLTFIDDSEFKNYAEKEIGYEKKTAKLLSEYLSPLSSGLSQFQNFSANDDLQELTYQSYIPLSWEDLLQASSSLFMAPERVRSRQSFSFKKMEKNDDRRVASVVNAISEMTSSVHYEIKPEELKYNIEKDLIAEGAGGKVFKGVYTPRENVNQNSKTSQGESYDVAIKSFDKNGLGFNLEEFNREVALANLLAHDNVVKCYGASTVDSYFLVLELCSKGALDSYINSHKMTYSKILDFSIQIGLGIEYIHSLKIIHRDIKSMNVLISNDGLLKLTDFGTSRILKPSKQMTQNIGTPQWISPEIYLKRLYDEKSDIYSFGLTLWELISGKIPFDDLPPYSISTNVSIGSRPSFPKSVVSPEFEKLICMCWTHTPQKRPSAKVIVEYLTYLKEQNEKDPFVPKKLLDKKSKPKSKKERRNSTEEPPKKLDKKTKTKSRSKSRSKTIT